MYTSNVDKCLTDWREASPYYLASPADCASPDNADSPGATFLTAVRDATLAVWGEDSDSDDYTGEASRIAGLNSDGGVFTIWTDGQWATWVDLAMWQEDLSEYFGREIPTDKLSDLPAIVAGIIGERLSLAIFSSLIEAREQDDEESEEDESDD